MQTIKCPSCGEEILIVPSLKKVVEAINNHLEKHEQEARDKGEKEVNIIMTRIKTRISLDSQVLNRIAGEQQT